MVRIHSVAVAILAYIVSVCWQQLVSGSQTVLPRLSPAVKSILDVAVEVGEREFVSKVRNAGLTKNFSAPGPFTIFGPTDKAYRSAPRFFNNSIRSTSGLQNHVRFYTIPQALYSRHFQNDLVVRSLSGADLRINVYKNGSVVTVGGCPVVLKDIVASNGVLHEISEVMVPPAQTLASSILHTSYFSKIAHLLSQAPDLVSLLSVSGAYTMLVPTDYAFNSLPPGAMEYLLSNLDVLQDVLSYHIIPGTHYKVGMSDGDQLTSVGGEPLQITITNDGRYVVNGEAVLSRVLSMKNGCMYYISRILLPPSL